MISLIITKIKMARVMLMPMLMMTAMSLIFTYVFGVGFSGDYLPTVYLVDEVNSDITKGAIESLYENKKYNFIPGNFNESLDAVNQGKAISLIYFHKNFSETQEIVVYQKSDNVEETVAANMVKQKVEELQRALSFSRNVVAYYEEKDIVVNVEGINNQLQSHKKMYPALLLESINYGGDNEDYNIMKHYFAGFTLFLSMFVITFGIGTIIEEKRYFVFQRIQISPLSTLSVMLATIFVNVVMGVTQLGLVTLLSHYAFDIDFGNHMGAYLLVLATYVITGTSIGLFVTTFVKTQSQLGAILPMLIVSTSMLGGCMWPLDIIDNKVLLFVANLTPQKWALEAVEKIIIFNGGYSDSMKSIVALLIMTATFIVGTVFRYDRLRA